MPELDILYMTRVQKERFFNEEDYIRLKNSYVLTKEKMGLAKPDMAVLHPLPRVNEIALDVDDARLRPYGTDHDPAGPARPQGKGGKLIC